MAACQPLQKVLQHMADERIKTLLSTTNMTFKQIVDQMRQENIKASLNDIRRVNKDNLYRKKRYDSKLTPQQRKQLIRELMNPIRPNLTALAEKYGVCHGSIWYWSDKMERIRARNNGIIPLDHPILAGSSSTKALAVVPPEKLYQDYLSPVDSTGSGQSVAGNNTESVPDTDDEYRSDTALMSGNSYDDWLQDNEQEQQDEQEEDCHPLNLTAHKDRKLISPVDSNYITQQEEEENKNCSFSDHNQELTLNDYSSLKLVGPVQALDLAGQFVTLPIMMYSHYVPASISLAASWIREYSTAAIKEQPMEDTNISPNNNNNNDNNFPLCLKKI